MYEYKLNELNKALSELRSLNDDLDYMTKNNDKISCFTIGMTRNKPFTDHSSNFHPIVINIDNTNENYEAMRIMLCNNIAAASKRVDTLKLELKEIL